MGRTGLGILFISHSSIDNSAALRIRDWLKENGWSQIFLDLDPAQGLTPGHRWQQELKLAGERCSGVVILLSPDWVASRWCQTEFLVADQLGKKIFPILVAPTPISDLPPELTSKFQIADISTREKEKEGFERLAIGMKRSGLDPQSFSWPPPMNRIGQSIAGSNRWMSRMPRFFLAATRSLPREWTQSGACAAAHRSACW